MEEIDRFTIPHIEPICPFCNCGLRLKDVLASSDKLRLCVYQCPICLYKDTIEVNVNKY